MKDELAFHIHSTYIVQMLLCWYRPLQVNNTDVSNMSHTQVVNLVRAAPKVVDLVVGRVLDIPKPPIEAHLLPDIPFQCQAEKLGNLHKF